MNIPRLASLAVMAVAAGTVAVARPASGQLRIVSYNVAASGSAAAAPRAGMESVLRALADQDRSGFAAPITVMMLQEGAGAATTGQAYADLLNAIAGTATYRASALDAATTGGGRPLAVYDSAAVTLVSEQALGTVGTTSQPRQTMRYRFRPVGYDATADFFVYNSHLKASNDSTSARRRDLEMAVNRGDADALGEGTNIIYAGDWNLYSGSEAAFQTLLAPGNGQAFDPLDAVGAWSGSAVFKAVHTQSPATVAVYGGQVTGGLNDRFDFQLVSHEWLDGRGLDYVPGSSWAFGNTNSHTMSGAVTTGSAAALQAFLPGYTTPQATAVLTALTQVTDHLPVVADYQLPARMAASLASPPSRVIRGATVSGTLTVANSAPVSVAAGADRLDYGFSGVGGFSTSGTGSDAALGGSNTHLLALSTTASGLRSGTVTVTATSPQAMSATFSGTVSTSVLERAIGSFSSASTTTTLTLDFGTLIQGGASGSSSFSIFNRPAASGTAWTARLDLDGVSSTLPSDVFSTSLSPFVNLAPGSSRSFGVGMTSAAAGSFAGAYTLSLSDEDLPGAASQSLSVSVRALVMPPVAGDVNRDAFIDILDMAEFLGAGRFDTGLSAGWSEGDFNADVLVDILDVADMLGADRFDQGDYRPLAAASAPGLAAVPEPAFGPATQVVLAAVGIGMLSRAGRKSP